MNSGKSLQMRGGYNVNLAGRPNGVIETLPEPSRLVIPLKSARLSFTEIAVSDGESVSCGQILATDPACFSLPLLASRGGQVRLNEVEGHIVIDSLEVCPSGLVEAAESLDHVAETYTAPKDRSAKIGKLIELGAWHNLRDAHTGKVPDPEVEPQAVIVSTVRSEPFRCRGDVLLRERVNEFMRGLEHIQSLLEYQPIYLLMPPSVSPLAKDIREKLRGHAYINLVLLNTKYPNYNFRLLTRSLGQKPEAEKRVWGIGVQGVLAVERALTHGLPCVNRVVSLGGPGVALPTNLRAAAGYPLDELLDSRLSVSSPRVINGGVLTGERVGEDVKGLDVECDSLTVLSNETERTFLAFVRPGFGKRSYSKTFMSSFRGKFTEGLTTALNGELRPCVSCGLCEDVCPAGIMPYLIHRFLYRDGLEDAEEARVDLCVGCGLCSYVCPSKIDLRQQLLDAQVALEELHAEEVPE
ncbi:4Fe-4S dicluster domain-containing protein [Candidatus Hydrogenedentota bacterium]